VVLACEPAVSSRHRHAGGSLPVTEFGTGNASRKIAAQQFLMNTPELLARVMEVILRRLKRLDRRGRGNPTASDRLDDRQRFQRVRGVAQVLMSSMKLLPLLLRELLWLTANVHVALLRAAGPSRVLPPWVLQP
jgi:hypothetical protein